jgi:hypothetical protein
MMVFDFSFVLVALAVLTGVIWGLDRWLFEADVARAGPRRTRCWSTTRARSSRSS